MRSHWGRALRHSGKVAAWEVLDGGFEHRGVIKGARKNESALDLSDSVFGTNPLTVAKAYSTLQHQGIIEARRGVGFFVTSSGRARLKEAERAKFLNDDWPAITSEIRRLGIDAATLLNLARRRFP